MITPTHLSIDAHTTVTRCVRHGQWDELYLTSYSVSQHDAASVAASLRQAADSRGADLLAITLFGGEARSQHDVHYAAQCPITWLASDTGWGRSGIYGQAVAIRGLPVDYLYDGRVVGSLFEDKWARYILLTCQTALQGAPLSTWGFHREFERLQARLQSAETSFDQVVRTWLYVDRILDCYNDLNKARTAFFKSTQMPPWGNPASTGVGISNAVGAGAVFGALAIQPLSADTTVHRALSPLQGGAEDYGSAFSRASEIRTPDYRRLYISGTASISDDGRSLHRNNLKAQITETMRVVDGILDANGYQRADVVRARAYLKHSADIEAARRHPILANIPMLYVPADICRDELLFEIELDALALLRR